VCDETESESRPVVALHRGTMSKPKIENFIKVDTPFLKKESLYASISSNVCLDVAVKNLFVLIVSAKKII
jgi:hypothetical protein